MSAYGFGRRQACPVCGSPRSSSLLREPFDAPPVSDYLATYYPSIDPTRLRGGEYELRRCEGCTLVFQRDVPSDDLLAEIYRRGEGDGSFEELDRRRDFQMRRGYAFQVEQLLKHAGRHPADVRVLDYGAGWGHWLHMAAAYGCRTSAVELADGLAAALAARGHEVLPPDALPDGAFDFINAEQVFEHLVEPRETLARLAAALAPGGVLRVNVPNGTEVPARLAAGGWEAPTTMRTDLNAVAPLEHLNCFDHEAVVALGATSGLRPFHYPVRQFLDPWERVRFIGSSLVHTVRPAGGTLVLFTPSA